jgi:outer membrane protein assembly factor BamE (lipoprotein component of BamABCDE complex)
MSNQDYAYIKKGAFMRAERPVGEKKVRRLIVRTFAAVSIALSLSACAGDIIKHGHVFTDEDLAQVKEGMSRDQVILALGTPDTKSTVDQKAFYYISTTTKRSAAFLPASIVDRRVVAVYFSDKDIVQRTANYGLQDGKVIDFVTRTTPSRGSEDGLLKELFRNIGRPQPNIAGSGGQGAGPGGY